MRKDYIEVQELNESEINFVESYWTKVWQNEGGPQKVK